MKKYLPFLLFLFLLFPYSPSFSQDLLGISTGNYAGISGVGVQPASIADSRHKFDINLFSAGVNYSNNYFLLDRDVVLKFNTQYLDNYKTFKDRYLTEANLGQGEKAFFNISNRTQLPLSFMATTGKNSAIALNLQFRTMVQGRGISQNLAKLAFNDFYYEPVNTSVDASGINLHSLSWAEAGLTYGRVLYSSGKHFLKAGVTGKYLAGLSSINLSSNNLQIQVNADSSFNFISPEVAYGHNQGADFNNLFDKNLNPDAHAFGLDAGIVYEYRGNIDRFKYLKMDDETSYDALRRDVNKYIFKVGVSLLDVGMFTFDKPSDVQSFSANINSWDLKNAQYNSISDFDTALASRVVPNPNNPLSYNVYLPTALSAQLDVKFVKGLFLNVRSYWPVELGEDAGQRFDKFGYYTITPRFETRHFGIYLPYTVMQRNDVTDYKQHMLGATLRLGPLFVGSSNLGSMVFDKHLKAADVHVGLKVGITYGKPNKSSRFLNTLFKDEQAIRTRQSGRPEDMPEVRDTLVRSKGSNRLILDYKNGKVYDNPDVKQNITIINNYYYGQNGWQTVRDSIPVVQGNYRANADSLQELNQQIAARRSQLVADSVSRVTTDSLRTKREELDSLIRSMQQLQIQMDSIRYQDSVSADSVAQYRIVPGNREALMVDSGQYMRSRRAQAAEDTRFPVRDSVLTDSLVLTNRDTALTYADKKKEPAASGGGLSTDSLLTARKAELDSLQKELQQRDSRLRMQDSLDAISRRYSAITDSLARENRTLRSGQTSPVPATEQNTAKSEERSGREKEMQQLQEQQERLYTQYARQANSLSRDIDRLNSRLSDIRRNDRTRNNYIPMPVPVNQGRQAPVEVSVNNRPDSIYIRDTITLRDTVTVGDTARQILVAELPAVQESLRDTVILKESQEEAAFPYTSLPEENVLFAVGRSDVQPIYKTRLDFLAGLLKQHSALQVQVTGHTDSTGSRSVNERLSLQRARAVGDYLTRAGVREEQIIIRSQSFESPAVEGNSAASRSQNRRVALKLVDSGS